MADTDKPSEQSDELAGEPADELKHFLDVNYGLQVVAGHTAQPYLRAELGQGEEKATLELTYKQSMVLCSGLLEACSRMRALMGGAAPVISPTPRQKH